jgi:pimeloyl-[acyl-carrier protein] synthase
MKSLKLFFCRNHSISPVYFQQISQRAQEKEKYGSKIILLIGETKMKKGETALVDPLNPCTEEFLSDPYPTFDQLRAAAPIFWSEKSKYWLVTSYEIGNEIVRDLRFEKRLERWNQINPIMKMLPGPAHLIKSRANWMINQNPPEHTHLRGLVNKAFSPKMVQQMHGSIQTVAERLIDNAVAKGGMEFISEFAFLVPITVICEMLGIPSADHEKFRQWSNAMTQTLEPGSITNPSVLHVSNHAGDELHDYLEPLVQERRKNPKADLITALVEAEIEGQKLEESEVIGNIMLLLVAGHETTVNLIGNGMFALCKHPDQL